MSNLLTDGYLIVEQFIDSQTVENLTEAIANCFGADANYGVRNLQYKVPFVYRLATSQMSFECLSEYTKECQFKLIKAIYFNKITQQNWSVPWHQDKTINYCCHQESYSRWL